MRRRRRRETASRFTACESGLSGCCSLPSSTREMAPTCSCFCTECWSVSRTLVRNHKWQPYDRKSLPHPPPVLYENVTTRLAEEGVGEGESGSARTEFFSSVVKGEASLKLNHATVPSSVIVPSDYGSASLFRRASKAAHWCLLQWQNKIHISLSALELLQGLAQLQFEYIGQYCTHCLSCTVSVCVHE